MASIGQALVAAATGKETFEPEGASLNAAQVFGSMLRKLRTSARIESEELAARASIEISRFQEIDSGLSEPNLVEVFCIARALDIPPSDLMKQFEDALSASIS